VLPAGFEVEGEAAPARKPIGHSNAPWTGDIEPVPFPFRPGLVVEPLQFGFEAGGEWLVMAGRDGLLQALAFDGSAPEVLPRPFLRGAVLKQVDAILGVNGGVVVCATAPSPKGYVYIAAHYDLATRHVKLHELSPGIPASTWSAFPDLHCVAVCRKFQQSGVTSVHGLALDLETGGQHPVPVGSGLCSRARLAWSRCQSINVPPYTLPVRTELSGVTRDDGPYLYLKGNRIAFEAADELWELFEPQRDGKPLLAGAVIEQAQLAGNTLLLALRGPHRRQLVLIEGPGGRVLGELPRRRSVPQSALSADGKLLVSVQGSRALTVHETHNITSPLARATWAGLHDSLSIRNHDPLPLVIRIGGFEHVFGIIRGELELVHTLSRGSVRSQPTLAKNGFLNQATAYDPVRFSRAEIWHTDWRTVTDSLGQVLLFRREGQLIATFLVRREKAAVWIPEGVYWGDPALIGGPASPNAARRIGAAIAAAGGET
jgi:hypothetical protein